MFWNASGIFVSVALLTLYIIQTVCGILKIPFSILSGIPISVVDAVIVIYWVVTNKKYTEKVRRFTMICIWLSALLGLIQVVIL